jgi:hypothetical protein
MMQREMKSQRVRETHRNVPDIGELRRNEEEKHNGTWEKFLYKH